MTTLFSPVGTADPITQLGDGPMLHIVRHCQPQRVVLFLSPKMAAYQQKDERYTKAIERLCASQGRTLPDIRLVESDYADVFRFDYYIGEFESRLKELEATNDGEPVLVNASSGTPAMEQALVALGSFGRLNLTMLQVPTPRRGANRKDDRENPDTYDLDYMWEWNEGLSDETPDAHASRIIKVATPNFADRLIAENIVAVIKNYGYESAYVLATQTRTIGDGAKMMIRAARDRLNLDSCLPAKVFAKTALAYRPDDLLGEFISVMEVRLAQGHWADFVRLLTPAFAQICKDVLCKNGLPERSYLKVENGRLTSKLDWYAIERDSRLKSVFGARPSGKSDMKISDWQLNKLVQEFCQDARVKNKIESLRSFEEKCRNPLAHELTRSTKESLERRGGLPLETILQYLFDLHGNMRLHLYEDINKAIIDLL